MAKKKKLSPAAKRKAVKAAKALAAKHLKAAKHAKAIAAALQADNLAKAAKAAAEHEAVAVEAVPQPGFWARLFGY